MSSEVATPSTLLDFVGSKRQKNGVTPSPLPATEPPRDCPRCPRLVALREQLRVEHPNWWNAPVPAWGDPAATIAIVGLAPGKQGANRTGRPFTGDGAGELLFRTLIAHGLAKGTYGASPDDGLVLTGAMILNAVRCLPPGNRPTPAEIGHCHPFLAAPLAALAHARVVVALGEIAHKATVRAFDGRLSAMRFGHGREHRLPNGRIVIDSYHCSQLNQNTGRLTAPMFMAVFARAVAMIKEDG